MAPPPKVVLLSPCMHTPKFSYPYPVKGDEVYCRQCATYRTVASTMEDYRVRCSGCKLSRAYGRDLGRAKLQASRHVTNTGHTAGIWYAGELIETVKPSDAQLELPVVQATTGRTGTDAGHQQRLKLLSNRDHPRSQ